MSAMEVTDDDDNPKTTNDSVNNERQTVSNERQCSEALVPAIIRRDFKQITALLDTGICPNKLVYVKKRFPIDWSRCRGPPERVCLIRTVPLLEACVNGDIKVVTLLLRHGADPFENIRDETEEWSSPIAEVVAEIEELKRAGRDRRGLLHLVSTILDFDSTKTERNIPRLMHAAIMADEPKLLEMILRHGGNIDMELRQDQPPKVSGSLLEIGIDRVSPRACSWLLRKGADPNTGRSVAGFTPLMRACRGWCADIVRELLQRGAEPTAVDRNGNHAFHYACQSLNWDAALLLTEKLCESGADVNVVSHGGTALDHLLDTWTRAEYGYGNVNTDISSFVDSICLLIWAGGKTIRNHSELIRIIRAMLNGCKARGDIMIHNVEKGLELIDKVIETVVMTSAVSVEEVSMLCDDIRFSSDRRLERSRRILTHVRTKGFTLKQSCRLTLRKMIRSPLKVNIMSDHIKLPRLLKEYIIGGRLSQNNK